MSIKSSRTATALMAVAALLGVSACTTEPVAPYAAAEHDGLRAFHLEAAQEYMEVEALLAGLAERDAYTAVGYKHGLASNGAELNVQHTTKYVNGSYLSLEQGIHAGETIDSYFVAETGLLYYLFGTVYQDKMDIEPWGYTTASPLNLQQDPGDACLLSAVHYACQLLDAWHLTQESLESGDNGLQETPRHLYRYANGSVLITTAVTVGSMVDAGLWVFAGDIERLITDETLGTLIPLRIWMNENGIVLKMEANGTVESPDSDLSMELQVGFEVTGNATQDDITVPIENLDEDNVFEMPANQAEFWDTIELIRIGEL